MTDRLTIAMHLHAALIATDNYSSAPIQAAREALVHADALIVAAEKPAEAAPVAPLPWVVRNRLTGMAHGAFGVCGVADAWRRTFETPDDYEVAAAPTVAAVKFDAKGDALLTTGGRAVQAVDGWAAVWSTAHQRIAVFIDLRPGEDAGETVAKMLAAVGRGP